MYWAIFQRENKLECYYEFMREMRDATSSIDEILART
jgi:hypothetical protein